MNIMYNNNFIYYSILNKVTQVLHHGIVDIYTNKVVWNTDKEVTFFCHLLEQDIQMIKEIMNMLILC